MNRFLAALAHLVSVPENLLKEKWLLAPNRRVGYQWLEQLTRAGITAFNVRPTTLRALAMGIAGDAMTRANQVLLADRDAVFLAELAWGKIAAAERSYFAGVHPCPGFHAALARSYEDLKLAGMGSHDIDDRHLETGAKVQALRAFGREFEKLLCERQSIDYAGILKLALAAFKNGNHYIGADALIIIPEDIQLSVLERNLLAAVPAAMAIRLPVDEPATPPADGDLTDAALLRWVTRPTDAPPPVNDGTCSIFRAIGECNEVREVLRRCAAEGVPFDNVEILYTDEDIYLPLFFETLVRFFGADGGAREIPATFAAGIPARYARPGRALQAWVSWIRDGFPQNAVVRMFQEGLLALPAGDRETAGVAAAWADALRAVPIVAGRARYREQLDRAVTGLERRAEEPARMNEDDANLAGIDDALACTRGVRDLIITLLENTPDPEAPPHEVLETARTFLTHYAAAVDEFERYVSKSLREEIERVAPWFRPEDDSPAVDIWDWLNDLSHKGVGGLGPREGCLHIAPLAAGGHSGRKRTFLVGLDDGRFPGTPVQDPILLDEERARVSADIPTTAQRQNMRVLAFERLLCRVRGEITLSFTGRGLDDDREFFPSPYLIGAFRALTGQPEGDLTAFGRWLAAQGPPASFAPLREGDCLDAGEWWMWRLCAAPPAGDPTQLVEMGFPHLIQGRRARESRARDVFTAHDGLVPAAGRDYDPFSAEGPVLSPGRLETLGTCPRRYFLRYILGIEKPDYHEVEAGAWLDPMTAGALLHEVFRRFMADLKKEGHKPQAPRDEDRILAVLDETVKAYQERYPEPAAGVFARQYRELVVAARTFLYSEAERCRRCEPAFFEIAIGLPGGGENAGLDDDKPAIINLPEGRAIRTRGRIDRVDREPDGSFAVWDYKTGGTGKYDHGDPFLGGRVIQNFLYPLMLETALARAGESRGRVSSFGFFFPGMRGQGARIRYPISELADGYRVIGLLCRLAAEGIFPPSNEPGDCGRCDFAEVCGDPAITSAGITAKLENAADESLTPFRDLRGELK